MMKLYTELANWWPLVSPPSDYRYEAADYARLFRSETRGRVRDILELGSGGGNNASHLKRHFYLTLVDPSGGMRRVSQALNPECAHRKGDMRTVRLGRIFDGVLVADAVSYMTTEADLGALMTTVKLHLRSGGIALFAPDATRETFTPGIETGGYDDSTPASRGRGRSLRYLEWILPLPTRAATSYKVHFAFLLKDRSGHVRSVLDAHRCGLFPRATWLRVMKRRGLVGRILSRVVGTKTYDVFVARKT